METKRKSLTIDMDPDDIRALKVLAVKRRVYLRSLVMDAIQPLIVEGEKILEKRGEKKP